MDSLTLSARAKINLTLAIVGTRPDGYHLLDSVMQEISLADTVSLERIPCGIQLICSAHSIPTDERNLCWKAAKAYLDACGLSGGVRIRLTKAIPSGAGMGGGSADAAAVLKGMKALYPSEVDLFSLGEAIGADVPFCLAGGTCRCQGIGERLTPVSFPAKKRLFCVIAKGCEGLSTPAVYRLFDAISPDQRPEVKVSQAIEALEAGRMQDFYSWMQNHLELPSVLELPEIAALKENLLSLGAEAAMMTGSGSAVFGLFSQRETAEMAAKRLRSEGFFSSFCTFL